MSEGVVQRVRQEVVDPLKQRFVGRDEVIELIALAAVAGEHLFLFGPPGTAKSALIRQFSQAVQGRYFEYMLTRFSEPNEIFGPIDIARLREGQVTTVTSGMLPEAEFVFLDELFNANSAILNNLLTVLNERIYRRGLETHRLPLISLYSASNHLPEEDALKALFDRFLLRCQVKNLKRDSMPQLLQAGWALETTAVEKTSITSDELAELSSQVYQVDLSKVMEAYIETIFKIRDLGIAFSDRRAVKVLKLLASSALLCGRKIANPADLWVLRYMWEREEQIDPLSALINAILQRYEKEEDRHPLSLTQADANGEDLARQLEAMEKEVENGELSLTAIARLKERLADFSDRTAWLSDQAGRKHLQERTRKVMEKLG